MVERIVEEVVIVVRVDLQSDQAQGATQPLSVQQPEGGGGSGPGIGSAVSGALSARLRSFVYSQINSLFAGFLSNLFGIGKKTTTETRSFRGGDSQFSASGTGGGTISSVRTTGASSTSSPVQASADLNALIARGGRNS